MTKNESETGMRITLISGLMIVAFMAFGLAISVYRMAAFDNSVDLIKVQNIKIEERIALKKQELDYYKSTQFKDKFAKENLQLVAPGEHVLIIESEPAQRLITDVVQQVDGQQSLFEEQLRQIPVYQHWQLFLFNKQAIEELQKTL